ncbi:hypothetical protein AM493_17405 [Flavobacterium akiainvivens]|uniref:Uncharacterized protein n=1 Tax=Flavobacterium akiainvivens TaxID=1202724 RepID=A0A0M9VJD4_9FLAO|nr:polysaccharide biosynthesis C-terminal domain-containing protein [Flavobacterium akiainvivens]KOS07619.1 hypothetical protein AM493_17405 [Flavobacterium akiainvivens]SFQ22855.1 Membrane protein involved in the export of O-antigen and teichoic acid [Flavobacterium akiainvivens]
MKSKNLQRQVFFFALINYMGTAIGIISALFIYPLDFAFSGTIKYIDNISQLLYPIMVLGASHALIKFYPALTEEKQKQLFNYSMVSVAMVSGITLVAIALFNTATGYKDAALVYFAFPVALSLAFIDLFRKQAQDLQRLAVPTVFEKIIPKITLPALFLLLIGGYFTLSTSLWVYAGAYLLILVLTAAYLFTHFKPGFNYRFKTLFGQISRRDYYRYSLYAFAGSVGSLLAFRIDGIVIYNWIGEEANGIFGNGSVLASTLQIPAVGMFALYAPLISKHLQENTLGPLNMKYKEIARLLFFIGALMYTCIFIGIEDLFSLLPSAEKLMLTVPVIFILGFSVLINMATGFNTEIITYSKYYRFNMVAILLLIVVNIGLNAWFVFVAKMGISGVAWASFISMLLFNASKLIFIYKKFGLFPFDSAFGKLAVVFALTGVGVYLLPDSGSHLINLIYKCGLAVVLNVFVAYRLKLVYQVNVWINKAVMKVVGQR